MDQTENEHSLPHENAASSAWTGLEGICSMKMPAQTELSVFVYAQSALTKSNACAICVHYEANSLDNDPRKNS